MAPSASLSAFEAADRLHKWVRVGKSFSGGERNNCFLNLGNSHFADVSGSSGFDTPDDARAVGLTDWDHDGDWDLWVANRNGPQLRFFQNHSERHGKSVMLSLVGTKCNRDAIGARVVGTLQKANENNNKPKQLIRTVRAGDGYLSQSSKLIHFGLGATAENVHIVVHWPSGDQQDYGVLKPGRYRLTQDDFSPIALSSLTTPHSLPAVTSQGLVSHDGRVASDTGRTVLASRIPVPQLAYRSSQPSEQSLSLKNGQPTLIHLWATWCDPCLQELGEHIRHANDLNAANLRVVVLSVPEPESNSRASYAQVLDEMKNSFEAGEATEATLDVLQVVHNHVFDRHRPLPVPTSFLFDRGGELAVIYKGPVTSEQLVADVKLLDHDVTKRRLASVPFVGRWHGPLGRLRLGPLAVALAESGHLDVAVRYA